MNTFDLSPLFRSTVGFDRLARLAEAAAQMGEPSQSYPPYNIEKFGEDRYSITLAVAGFAEDELDVELRDGLLTVRGSKTVEGKDESVTDQVSVLHRGIASRDFLRRFQLADHLVVTGARLENGLLRIDMVREVPEEAKPRRIPIGSTAKASQPAIESGAQKTERAA